MASLHLRCRSLIFYILCLLLSAVYPSHLQAEAITDQKTAIISAPLPEDFPGEEGIASYYAKRYQNRRTHSGVRYDAAKLTAAHPTLPHGTKVRVINLTNDKEVIVTINDRCRPRSKPFIDLSRAAAKQLGFLGKGIARVRIIPLDDDEES